MTFIWKHKHSMKGSVLFRQVLYGSVLVRFWLTSQTPKAQTPNETVRPHGVSPRDRWLCVLREGK